MGILSDIIERHEAAGTQPEHSPIGASGAHRYINCPGSVAKSLDIVEEASEFAQEGTAAHEICDRCLKGTHDAWEFYGEKVNVEGTDYEVDQEMVEACQMYVNTVKSLAAWDDCDPYFEHRVVASSIHPLLYGTVDTGLVFKQAGHVDVVDFKYGAGIAVDAIGNPQGRIYARGLLDTLKLKGITTVRITIVQPRAYHPDGPVRSEYLTLAELEAWENDVLKPALEAVDSHYASVCSGEHCRFCPARASCEVLLDAVVTPMEGLMDDEDGQGFDDQTIGDILEAKSRLTILMKAIGVEAYKRMMRGKEVPGMKLVRNKADRVWKDGAKGAAKELFDGDAYAPRKLKSPAQMGKLLGGDEFVSEWAYKPDAGLTTASVDDKRESVSRSPRDIFQDVNQKEISE